MKRFGLRATVKSLAVPGTVPKEASRGLTWESKTLAFADFEDANGKKLDCISSRCSIAHPFAWDSNAGASQH